MIAESSRRLTDFVPSPTERAQGLRHWNAAQFLKMSFSPQTTWPDTMAAPLTVTRRLLYFLTSFACGGVGIALKTVDALADAGSMMSFMRGWAATNRAMAEETSLPNLNPVFDPSLLEKATGGT
jgi:hypothetical protein